MNSFRHMVTCGVSVHVAFREVNGICQATDTTFFQERCGSELDEMRRECQEAVAAQMELQRQESGSSTDLTTFVASKKPPIPQSRSGNNIQNS